VRDRGSRHYRYFKVKGDDGNLYVLRLDEDQAEDLIMFQSAERQALAAHPHASHDSKKGIDGA
jgi:Ser/Thr protein kinase RdoA (MazF antagonist)